MGRRRYQADGFIPITDPPARRHLDADTDTFVKGDAIHDDGSGYATNAATDFAATFKGICAASYNNSGGSQGGVKVEIYPFDFKTQYIVPVASTTLITQGAIGTFVDLENNDDIDLTDTLTEGVVFKIDDIDVSAEAVAANAYGYAIGHFEVIGTQT